MAGPRPYFALMALGLGVLAAPASAQDTELSTDPVVRAVQEPLAAICRRQGRYPWFVPDFISGVDAEGDRKGSDLLLDGAGFSCVRSRNGADAGVRRPMCISDRICTQWLIVDGAQGRRVVWSGTRPNLVSMGEDGLLSDQVECQGVGCDRVVWNGGAFVPVGPRR